MDQMKKYGETLARDSEEPYIVSALKKIGEGADEILDPKENKDEPE